MFFQVTHNKSATSFFLRRLFSPVKLPGEGTGLLTEATMKHAFDLPSVTRYPRELFCYCFIPGRMLEELLSNYWCWTYMASLLELLYRKLDVLISAHNHLPRNKITRSTCEMLPQFLLDLQRMPNPWNIVVLVS